LSIESVLWLLAILVLSLSFHEAAHAWTANRLGDPTARLLGRLTLNPVAHVDWIGTVLFPVVALMSNFPLIGWAKPVPVNMHNLKSPRRDFAIVALAGPVSNMILAVVFAALLAVGPFEPGSVAWYVVRQMVGLNVLLAIFNFLPVPPLDGGNVLAGVVPESAARMLDAMRPWGFVILYALMFSGVFERLIIPIYEVILLWLT
jgi:Zn-dependent protease